MSLKDIVSMDLLENSATRLPICLCLDISPSMSGRPEYGSAPGMGSPIDELNKGVQLFYQNLKENLNTAYSADVSIVAFSSKAWTVRDFETIANAHPPKLELDMKDGGTSLGTGVESALELLNQRKQQYKNAGLQYYQPWLVVMTDGYPTDQTHLTVCPQVVSLESQRKLVVFPIAIGANADTNALGMLSGKRTPARLKGLKFDQLFEWLSASAERVALSRPGENVQFPKADGWQVL